MLAHRARQNLVNAAIKQNADGIARAKSKALANRSRAEQVEADSAKHFEQVLRMSSDANLYKQQATLNSPELFTYLATGIPNDKLSDQFESFNPLTTLTNHSFDMRFLAELIVRSARSLSEICSTIDKTQYPNSTVIAHQASIADLLMEHNLKLSAQLQAFVKLQADSKAIAVASGNLLKALHKLNNVQIKAAIEFITANKQQMTFSQAYQQCLSELKKNPQIDFSKSSPNYLFEQKFMAKFGVDIYFSPIANREEKLRQVCPINNHLLKRPEFNFLYFDEQYYQKALNGSLTCLEVAIKFESLQTNKPGLLQYLPQDHKLDQSLEAVYDSLKAGM
ncbi:hypothetical protein [Shewanella marisflavi]|uniref:hypothetical protein n=1 Tax=Shewanella marisflavi TaxID=260364 RepID=UPI003AAD296E